MKNIAWVLAGVLLLVAVLLAVLAIQHAPWTVAGKLASDAFLFLVLAVITALIGL